MGRKPKQSSEPKLSVEEVAEYHRRVQALKDELAELRALADEVFDGES